MFGQTKNPLLVASNVAFLALCCRRDEHSRLIYNEVIQEFFQYFQKCFILMERSGGRQFRTLEACQLRLTASHSSKRLKSSGGNARKLERRKFRRSQFNLRLGELVDIGEKLHHHA